MTGPLWIIPIEAVRASASLQGCAVLTSLAARHALLQPHATVELGEAGFVATVQYFLPGYVARAEQTHVALAWVAQENALGRVANEVGR